MLSEISKKSEMPLRAFVTKYSPKTFPTLSVQQDQNLTGSVRLPRSGAQHCLLFLVYGYSHATPLTSLLGLTPVSCLPYPLLLTEQIFLLGTCVSGM